MVVSSDERRGGDRVQAFHREHRVRAPGQEEARVLHGRPQPGAERDGRRTPSRASSRPAGPSTCSALPEGPRPPVRDGDGVQRRPRRGQEHEPLPGGLLAPRQRRRGGRRRPRRPPRRRGGAAAHARAAAVRVLPGRQAVREGPGGRGVRRDPAGEQGRHRRGARGHRGEDAGQPAADARARGARVRQRAGHASRSWSARRPSATTRSIDQSITVYEHGPHTELQSRAPIRLDCPHGAAPPQRLRILARLVVQAVLPERV